MTARRATCVLLALALPASAAAAEPVPIVDNDWTLGLHQGPVVGSVRVVGLGGSYVGVGEGVEGLLYNPASLANRSSRSQDWFEWDIGFDWVVLGPLGEVDFFNDGPLQARYHQFQAGLVGVGLQFGRLGVGLAGRFQTFQVDTGSGDGAEQDKPVELTGDEAKLGVAWTLDWFGYEEAMVLGAGLRIVVLNARPPDGGQEHTLLRGGSFEGGLLWRPPGECWRLGAVLRLPTRGTREEAAEGDEREGPLPTKIGDRHLPGQLLAPWELAVGFSWMFGPFGPSYNSVREAVRVPVPGGRLLLTADVVLTGSVQHGEPGRATGMSGFTEQVLVPAKTEPSLSPRVGVEHDWFPTRLRVRGGAYVEPARFEGVDARPHLTGGW